MTAQSTARIGVMHLTDTLDAGGAERVAVNIVNHLPRERYRAHLCTTRRGGILDELIAPDVGRLRLTRRRRFDTAAVRRLTAYIRKHQIKILHAHGPSLFTGEIAALFPPRPAVIWHHHYGRCALEDHPAGLYRLAALRMNGVITVNQPLAEWSRRRLHLPDERVWYIPNFVSEAKLNGKQPELPGTAGHRIVCVANLHVDKDQITLVRAMALVAHQVPEAHLLLVGAATNAEYSGLIKKEIEQHGLDKNVSLLGQQREVPAILRACDIGVMSSASEGLPLALIEYGMAGLPTVATRVGQCAEVLDEGRAGVLVPCGEPRQLAEALLLLLKSPEQRAAFGAQFHRRVQEVYSAGPILEQICRVYDSVLSPKWK